MAIQTQFYNWQTNDRKYDWDAEPFEACQPAAQSIRRYLEERWGCLYLGCHGDRNVVGGATVSTHAFGAVPDMRYESPGPGLYVCDTEIIPFLIATSAETGVQAIHHYKRSTIWRPPGTSGRLLGSDGWKTQRPGTQMGQSWALWLHIEIHPDQMADGRDIAEKVAGETPVIIPSPPTPPVVINPPITPPVLQPGAKTVVNVTVETVRRGSTGPKVKKLQALLNHSWGQNVGPVDGSFGAKTADGVLNVQRFMGLKDDGIVGPRTWTVLINFP